MTWRVPNPSVPVLKTCCWQPLGLDWVPCGSVIYFYAYEELMQYFGKDETLVAAVSLGIPDEAPGMRPRKPFRGNCRVEINELSNTCILTTTFTYATLNVNAYISCFMQLVRFYVF